MTASIIRVEQPPGVPDGITVTRDSVGRRAVLSVSGEIDMGSVPTLTEAIDAALAGGAAELWIDLTTTSFMDSSGLHLLLQTRERIDALNRRLAIICPGGRVRRLFDLTGLGDRLPLYSDRSAAHRAA